MRRFKDEYYWLPENTRTNKLLGIVLIVIICIFFFSKESYVFAYEILLESVNANALERFFGEDEVVKEVSLEIPIFPKNENQTGLVFEISGTGMTEVLEKYPGYDELKQYLRQYTVKQLVDRGYGNFDLMPFGPGNHSITLINSGGNVDIVIENKIEKKDNLDELIHKKMQRFSDALAQIHVYEMTGDIGNFGLTQKEIDGLGEIFLFKDSDDLEALGYEVVSWRTRVNYDKWYRRFNISTAFWNIGNTKIIMPGHSFSFLKNIHYSSRTSNYKKAFTNSSGLYGDGICGGATAVLQWILTNTAFDIIQKKNHSTWYSKYYKATINWQYIATPGIDATVISSKYGMTDLVFKNNSQYPVILVMNYDGESGSEEQVFTLAPIEFKWSFEFSRRVGKCYNWNVNGGIIKGCYGMVL